MFTPHKHLSPNTIVMSYLCLHFVIAVVPLFWGFKYYRVSTCYSEAFIFFQLHSIRLHSSDPYGTPSQHNMQHPNNNLNENILLLFSFCLFIPQNRRFSHFIPLKLIRFFAFNDGMLEYQTPFPVHTTTRPSLHHPITMEYCAEGEKKILCHLFGSLKPITTNEMRIAHSVCFVRHFGLVWLFLGCWSIIPPCIVLKTAYC